MDWKEKLILELQKNRTENHVEILGAIAGCALGGAASCLGNVLAPLDKTSNKSLNLTSRSKDDLSAS